MNNLLQLKNLKSIGFAIILFWLLRDFAFAAEATNGMNTVIDVLNGIIAIIAFVAHPLVMLIGWLLSPDWTFGDIIGLRPALHKMWTLVSNVVYVIFAFLLIAIAFMNVFSENKNFAIKTSLPRLIIGILMVPFTWLIVSLTLSVSNVLTASVITIPFDSINMASIGGDDSVLDKFTIPKKISLSVTESGSLSSQKSEETLSLKDLIGSQNGAYNLLSFYAYGIFKIDKLKDIGVDQKGAIKQVGDVFKKLTFGLIFALIFSLLVIAIAFALITRIGMLWMYAIFSPLFALSFFLSGKGGSVMKKLEDKINLIQFISLAMVPVYVAAALSFGLMFLSLAMNMKFDNKDSPVQILKVNNGKQEIKFGDFTLEIEGNYQDEDGIAGGLFSTAQGLISNIIVSFMALVILRMAVMAALGANKITEKAVEPIKSFGDSIGKLAVDMPKYAPIPIPGSGGKSMSMSGLQSMGNQISSSISTAAQTQGTEFGTVFGKKLSETMGLKIDEGLNKANSHTNSTNISKQTNNSEVGKDLDKVLTLMGKNLEEFSTNATATGIFANRISQINDRVINKEGKEEIIKLLKSGSAENVTKAMTILEEKLGADNFGGVNKNLGNRDDVEKYFNLKKSGTETDSTKSSSGSGKLGITSIGYDSQFQSKVVQVDNNTTILVKTDGTGLGNDKQIDILKNHFNNDVKKGNITLEEFNKWINDIGLSSPESLLKKLNLGDDFFKKSE